MAVLKWMLKLALLPLLLLLILAQWVGIFLTTFSTILTNLLAGFVLLRGSGKLDHEAGRRRRSPENADYRICGFRPTLHSDSCYRKNLLFR